MLLSKLTTAAVAASTLAGSFLLGGHAHRVSSVDAFARVAEARRAMADEDWDRAYELTSSLEPLLNEAHEIRNRADTMREQRVAAAEIDAALAARNWMAAEDAYERIGRDRGASPYVRRYVAGHEQAVRITIDEHRVAALRLLAAHDCSGLREITADAIKISPTIQVEAATWMSRCYRERTAADVLRTAEGAERVDERDRLSLLSVVGPDRPRGLRALGAAACREDPKSAKAAWRSLDGADRRAFASGCVVAAGVDLPSFVAPGPDPRKSGAAEDARD